MDRYLTASWATSALLAEFPEIRGGLLVDPSAGDGRMAEALRPRFDEVLLNDLDPSAPTDLHLDGADPAVYARGAAWSVSNPPFVAAGDIVWAALRGGRSVAMLLRCTFGEPCQASHQAPRNGRQWLKERPPTALLMLPRISFTGDGSTDSAPCWWFIWSPEMRPRIVVKGRAESAGQLSLGGLP